MLVISRKQSKRLFARPHKAAAEALELLPQINHAIAPGEVQAWEAIERLQAILEKLARDEVVVTVIRIGPAVVKLGVDADRGRELLREELIPSADHEGGAAA